MDSKEIQPMVFFYFCLTIAGLDYLQTPSSWYTQSSLLSTWSWGRGGWWRNVKKKMEPNRACAPDELIARVGRRSGKGGHCNQRDGAFPGWGSRCLKPTYSKCVYSARLHRPNCLCQNILQKRKKGLLAEEKENSKETEECRTRMFQVEPRGNLFCLWSREKVGTKLLQKAIGPREWMPLKETGWKATVLKTWFLNIAVTASSGFLTWLDFTEHLESVGTINHREMVRDAHAWHSLNLQLLQSRTEPRTGGGLPGWVSGGEGGCRGKRCEAPAFRPLGLQRLPFLCAFNL